MNAPFLSLVIPVYNVGKYLPRTLGSALGQTFRDIEVVPVDDGSADDSREIIGTFAARDSRVRPLLLPRNTGSAWARKAGTEAAGGRFIVYMDGDDTLVPEACGRIAAALRKEPVDLLQFNEKVVDETGLKDEAYRNVKRYLRTYIGRITSDDLIRDCVVTEYIPWNVHGKAFDAALAKRAAGRMKDSHIVMADDLYFFFIFLYYARTYRGLGGKGLYEYYFGRGITGRETLDLATFGKYCRQYIVHTLLEAFLEEEKADEKYFKSLRFLRGTLLGNCVQSYLTLAENDRAAGYEMLMGYVKDGALLDAAIADRLRPAHRRTGPEKFRGFLHKYLPKRQERMLKKIYKKL
ncbi:MAG: glycosyltransferase [Clostridiales Family XIII bacterium]|jgi:glycosyltransferase involved in cell wall biosynthesis|nr:glycosyltransferase [Clostridiales Family XIII bacterium]